MIASSIIDTYPDFRLLGFLNDVVPVGDKIGRYKQIEVIGTSLDVAKFTNDKNVYFFIAYLQMLAKHLVYNQIKQLGISRERFINLVHPTAVIPYNYCSIGCGVLFAPLAHLSPDTKIGDNCSLLSHSFVGHNSTLDEFVSVANNATIGGNVYIGKGAHIGSNATIREDITIGEFSIIGMGSVVLKDVPPNTVVAGNPAKIIRSKSW